MKRWLWALDAFQQPDHSFQNTVGFLRGLKGKVSLEPVYVLSPDQLNVGFAFNRSALSVYQSSAEKAMKQLLTRAKVKMSVPPQILVENRVSLSSATRMLSGHAKQRKAHAIVLSTHALKGIRRLLLGSFTETLLNHSEVPLLVINPRQEVVSSLTRALFPTDLSPASRLAAKNFVHGMQGMVKEVVLFHVIPNPVEPIIQSGVFLLGGGWVPLKTYLNEEKERSEKKLEAIARALSRSGVKVRYEVIAGTESVSGSVIKAAKREKCDLIALAAESGPVASAFVGSITRQILRESSLPVWVQRSKRR